MPIMHMFQQMRLIYSLMLLIKWILGGKQILVNCKSIIPTTVLIAKKKRKMLCWLRHHLDLNHKYLDYKIIFRKLSVRHKNIKRDMDQLMKLVMQIYQLALIGEM